MNNAYNLKAGLVGVVGSCDLFWRGGGGSVCSHEDSNERKTREMDAQSEPAQVFNPKRLIVDEAFVTLSGGSPETFTKPSQTNP